VLVVVPTVFASVSKFSELGDPRVVRLIEPVPVSAEIAGSNPRNTTGKAIASAIEKVNQKLFNDRLELAPSAVLVL